MFRLIKKSRPLSEYWRDIAWQASGNTLAQVVAVLGIPLLTRLYTPEDFAIQSLFIQVVTFATALVTWRYEYFIQLPKDNGDANALNGLVFILGLLSIAMLTPVMWVFRDAIAIQLGDQGVAPWLCLAPVTAVLVSWAMAAQNNAQRFRDFKNSGMSELVGKVTYVVTGILGALGKQGTAGLILTTAMGAVGKSAYVFFKRPQWGRDSLRTEVSGMRRVSKVYSRLATSTVLSHLLTTSATAMPLIALARLYGADVLGQFALVMATIYLPSGLLGMAIGQVYYQRAAKLWADGNTFFSLWRNTALKLLQIGAPVYGLVVLLAGVAYPFVFGDQWYLAGEFATWMAVAAFASFASSPMDRTCLVVGAWQYSILWSIYRLATTAVVIWIAWVYGLTRIEFVVALVVQKCLAYGIDLWMGYRFSQGRLGVFARA